MSKKIAEKIAKKIARKIARKIALIDGYGFVFRAYHSMPPLSRSDGTPVGAVYGFTNMLIKLLASLDVTHVAVVFDAGSKTFRNDIYPDYKANRPPCPEDLKPQFSIVRESAESLNLAILEKTGFEADDIIATMAKKSAAEDFEVLIVSSDKDLMQLVDENISMYDPMKNRLIGIPEVQEKFSVGPDRVLDVLSLMGDASDNVPGVRGIGPKTAAELINQFGTLENIFLNLDHIKQKKRKEVLSEGVENAKLSKILITLKEDVDIGIEIEDLKLKSIEPEKLISFLDEQGFRSLVTRVKKDFGISGSLTHTESPKNIEKNNEKKNIKNTDDSSFKETKIIEITSEEIVHQINEEALRNGIATIDGDEDFMTISTAKFGEATKEVFYFETKKIAQVQDTDLFATDLFAAEEKNMIAPTNGEFGLDILTKIMQDDSIKKILFDAKKFFKIWYKFDEANKSRSTSFEDVLLMNHLIHSTSKNHLKDLIHVNLNENIEESGFADIFSEIKKGKTPEIFEDKDKKAEFLCFRNFAIHQIYRIFLPQIFELKLVEAYEIYEKPLLEALAQMELNGIKIDIEKLHALSVEFGQKINTLTSEIYALAGCEFNIASPKQLGEILFEKLHLESSKKSKKTGALSTGAAVLEELEQEGHIIARKILEFRKYSKLKNTYTDALPKEINPETGRIHTTFSSTSTITGRLSSSHPNLQNIPIRSPEGKKIRESFIAQKGHLLIAADYSQIELRVIAHVAKIENLITAFKENKDIHRITASQIFKIPEEEIDSETRSKAKAINFGIIYGISAFGLAKQLNIGRKEAAEYIKSYLEAYPGIEDYMKKYTELAHQNGYVQTFSGRKCSTRDINHKNGMVRAEAERLAINAPIQGSAADIIKKAAILLQNKFTEKALKSKIILQVHDELIVEAPEDEVEIASKILKSEMENAMILDVPLKVDVETSLHWS